MDVEHSNDMQLLQRKLDNHIEEYQQYRENEERRWSNLITTQERNTDSIKELTESTRDLVSVWQSVDGTMKIMSVLGRFVKWLSGFAVIGFSFNWVIENIK